MAASKWRRQTNLLRPLRITSHGPLPCKSWLRWSSALANIPQEMLNRPSRVYRDWPTETPTELLQRTLFESFSSEDKIYIPRARSILPLGHHLVYFPVPANLASLLSDGTDILHSPGPPFARRMWAGGTMVTANPLSLDGTQHICRERIVDVQIKGPEFDEKIFVKLSRWIGPEKSQKEEWSSGRWSRGHQFVTMKEERTLVFMRAKSTKDGRLESATGKILKPPDEPDYSEVITPTAQLLFRFSALTWNAHKIHLDKEYCREVEGYRNLVVHGPLTVILMLRVLRNFLQRMNRGGTESAVVQRVEYRNLAPLFAEEPMKICVKRKRNGPFILWIEGVDGGYAVKGTAHTSTTKDLISKHIISKEQRHSAQAEKEVSMVQAGEAEHQTTA